MPFEIFVVFRCLNKNSGWKTKGRFYVENGTNILGIDLVVYDEDFEKIQNNKILQIIG